MSYSDMNRPISIVDPSWEYIDPTPDIFAMFQEYDKTYFGGTLSRVELKWSKRMTSCAGLMAPLEGKGGACSIRLSEPLLKLRSRKDLVETLLHEMIHAHLHVTKCQESDPHGPKFKEHMYRINKAAGTNITVYHNFYDEVNLHKQHWWRCNGPCQHWRPFYGWVKRATNRAPSKNDLWSSRHQQTCGGEFIKVKEPDNYGKKKEAKVSKNDKKTSSKNGNLLAMIKKKYILNHPKPTVISKFTNKSKKSSSNKPSIQSPLKDYNTSVVTKKTSSTSSPRNTLGSSASFSKDTKAVGNGVSQSTMNNFLGQLHKERLERRLMSQTHGHSSLTQTKKREHEKESGLKYVKKKHLDVSESQPPQITPEIIRNKLKVNEKDIAHSFKRIQNQNTTSTQLKISSPPDGRQITSNALKVLEKKNSISFLEKSSLVSKDNKCSTISKDKRGSLVSKDKKGAIKPIPNHKNTNKLDISKLFSSSKDTNSKLPVESKLLSELIVNDEMKQNTSLLSDEQLKSLSPSKKKTETSVPESFTSSVSKEHNSFSNSSLHNPHKHRKLSTTDGKKSPKLQSTLSNSDPTSTKSRTSSHHSTSKSSPFLNNSSIKDFFDCGGTSNQLTASGSNNANPIIIDNSYDSDDSDEANVSCPVCKKHIPEILINKHLDKCLSMKLISENVL